ncbi:unnamed protein product [Chondrus crispus]|uniref:Uncharacterized protein n=1 Tax=Chondrus crispus TaxID=2769 RepID=R7Q391_CHOCR|nr:unnamed protein product [Chondrus crispus]CDF33002.1 unnamed protein product [Chondrus crispus]|eukprot:XP_005712805.1 unnamed protein product [Chondrus crispus]
MENSKPALTRHLLAVPNCREQYGVSITEAGSDAGIFASLTNKNGHPKLHASETSGITASSFKATKEGWTMTPQRDGAGKPSISAARKKSHAFEIERGAEVFQLRPANAKRDEYHLVQENETDSNPMVVCVIKIESVHAWSYRIRCKPSADLMLPLFAFWLVVMSKSSIIDRSKDSKTSKCPRRLLCHVPGYKERNHMAMQIVS